MTLPELAVRRPIATLMVLVCILVFGTIAIFRIQLAYMPEYEEKRLHILVTYANASAKATERLILKPIEDAVSSMNGLRSLYSRAGRRGPRVSLNFVHDINIDTAKSEVQDRIDRIRDQLPDDIERIQVSSKGRWDEDSEIILESRIASGRDLSKNYDLLDHKIIRPLQRVPGIAFVELDGVNPPEVRINLQLDALKRHQITAQQVWRTLQSNNRDFQVGALRNENQKAIVRALGTFDDVEAMKNFPITPQVKLSDIAEVTFREPPLQFGRHLDGEFAVSLKVGKESSANTIAVTEAVHKEIDNIRNDPALHGINFLVWTDKGKEIKKTIDDLEQTGVLGALLASIILFIFLRRIGSTIIAVLCIPFSIIAAIGVTWFNGKDLDTITLLGLIVGIGMLVDNAVVIIENIDRYQKKGFPNKVAAILGAKEVSVAVITATLTSLIVFLPLIFTKSSEFNFQIKYLAITISITLLASLFISQTLIPIASQKLPTKAQRKPSKLMNAIENRYEKILSFSVNHSWLAIVFAIGVIAISIYPIKNITYNLDAPPQQIYAQLNVQFTDPLSLNEKEKILTRIEKAFEPMREPFNLDAIYGWWSQGFSIVRLYMKSGYQDEKNLQRVRKAMPKYLPEIPGVKLSVSGSGRFWDRNRGKRIGIQITGNDSATLETIANQAKEAFETIPGLYNVRSSGRGNEFELEMTLDNERLANYGLRSLAPANMVDMTFRGRMLTKHNTEYGEVDTRLVLEEMDHATVNDIEQLQLTNNNNENIPIGSVSEFKQTAAIRNIERTNKATQVFIGGSYEKGQREDYLKQMIEKAEAIPLPEGFQWKFNPNRQRIEKANNEYLLNVIMALALIFAVMASLFESKRQALALMVALPFALAGAFWSLYLFNIDFDRAASIALLLLLGIVVNNGIVMVEHINLYRRQGMERHLAMLKGGRERLRPIIMTALTTLVGLIPIAVQKPSLGGVYYYSMAYVIIGGLLFSTLLTTLLLPATIALVEDSSNALTSFLKKHLRIKTFITSKDPNAS